MNEDQVISCETHGAFTISFVCSHLILSLQDGEPRGVHWTRDEDDCINAWCSTCEALLSTNKGDWNEHIEEFADIQLICEACFDSIVKLNDAKGLH